MTQVNQQLPKRLRFPDLPEGYDKFDPWAKDLAPNRKLMAESLGRYFESISGQTGVVAIDAGWGSGKSLFLRMWQDSLLNDGKPCLYFNAWQYDFSQSPVASFLAALQWQVIDLENQLAEQNALERAHTGTLEARKGILASLSKTTKKFSDKISQHWAVISPSIRAAIPGAFAGVVACTVATNGSPESSQAVFEAVKASGEALQEQYSAKENAKEVAISELELSKLSIEHMHEFRRRFEEYAKSLCEDGQSMPLIVMVDELDRCRPSFAIQLLEEIKHLFSVPGVFFVLAVEKEQLTNCISATYGLSQSGSRTYLDKFIDMTVQLPPVEISKFFNKLLDLQTPLNEDRSYRESLVSVLHAYASDISLRTLAQAVTKIGFICAQRTYARDILYASVFVILMTTRSLTESYQLVFEKGIRIKERLLAGGQSFDLNLAEVVMFGLFSNLYPANITQEVYNALDSINNSYMAKRLVVQPSEVSNILKFKNDMEQIIMLTKEIL